ncbi:hypothetical protein AB7645_13290 [Bradyrhizobium sp. 956_D2_N1_5]|uniref:hypothetical protein n=1 Tax=unclassified Bradyrhizobium TaxID=2631580 RepID=UPI003F24F2D3
MLALLSTVEVWLLVRDFGVRLSQPPIDEGPVAHAYYFANPGNFSLDAYMTVWTHVGMSSVTNWLPAFLFKYLSVPPEIFYALFVILQAAGLSCACYYFAMTLFKSRGISWLTALFVLMWRPHFFSPALIGGLDWMPYANWLALPCLIMAAAMVVQERVRSSTIWLAVGAAIHPIMALIATMFVLAYIVTQRGLNVRTVLLAAGAGSAVLLVAYVPGYISTRGLATISMSAKALLNNAHIYPLGAEYPYGLAAFINGIFWTVGLFLLGLSGLAGASRQARWFLFSAGAMTGLACALHVLAVILQFAPVMNLILSRACILLLLVSIPFVVRRLVADLASGSPLRVIAALLLLFNCCTLSILGLVALSLRPAEIAGNRVRTAFAWMGSAVALVTSVVLLVRHVPGYSAAVDQKLLFWMGSTIGWMLTENRLSLFRWDLFIACTAVIALASIFARTSWGRDLIALPARKLVEFRAAVAVVACALIVAMSLDNAATGLAETTGVHRDLYDAQVWARDHARPGSAFINTGLAPLAWRGVSRRQTVVTYFVGNVYVSTPEAQKYNARLTDFKTRNMIVDGSESWARLDENQWRAFKSEFGGDYLVRKAGWNSLSFPVVFSNHSFVIYKLDG